MDIHTQANWERERGVGGRIERIWKRERGKEITSCTGLFSFRKRNSKDFSIKSLG